MAARRIKPFGGEIDGPFRLGWREGPVWQNTDLLHFHADTIQINVNGFRKIPFYELRCGGADSIACVRDVRIHAAERCGVPFAGNGLRGDEQIGHSFGYERSKRQQDVDLLIRMIGICG